VHTHSNLKVEERLELYETGMFWIRKSLWLNFCQFWCDTGGFQDNGDPFFLFYFIFTLFLYFIFTFIFIFYLQNQYKQIAHVLRFFFQTLLFSMFIVKKKSTQKNRTTHLPHVRRTCGCEVNLPHNRTCGSLSILSA
jgi:hypothetical protein